MRPAELLHVTLLHVTSCPCGFARFGLAWARNRYPTDVHWLDIRAPTRFRGNWFLRAAAPGHQIRGPARQRLLEMLCDAFQRARVREGQGPIGLRVHSQAAKPPQCLVGMDERKAERIRDIAKDDDQCRDVLAALGRPTLNIFSWTKLFPRQIVSKTRPSADTRARGRNWRTSSECIYGLPQCEA
jgi:hypothetical protein